MSTHQMTRQQNNHPLKKEKMQTKQVFHPHQNLQQFQNATKKVMEKNKKIIMLWIKVHLTQNDPVWNK